MVRIETRDRKRGFGIALKSLATHVDEHPRLTLPTIGRDTFHYRHISAGETIENEPRPVLFRI